MAQQRILTATNSVLVATFGLGRLAGSLWCRKVGGVRVVVITSLVVAVVTPGVVSTIVEKSCSFSPGLKMASTVKFWKGAFVRVLVVVCVFFCPFYPHLLNELLCADVFFGHVQMFVVDANGFLRLYVSDAFRLFRGNELHLHNALEEHRNTLSDTLRRNCHVFAHIVG